MCTPALLTARLSDSRLLPFSLSDYPTRLKGFSEELKQRIGSQANLAPLDSAINTLQTTVAVMEREVAAVMSGNVTTLNTTQQTCKQLWSAQACNVAQTGARSCR